jgi:hypothetical protein
VPSRKGNDLIQAGPVSFNLLRVAVDRFSLLLPRRAIAAPAIAQGLVDTREGYQHEPNSLAAGARLLGSAVAFSVAVMGRVLGIACRTLASHQVRKAGHTQRSPRTGTVTFIQRFGSALNLDMPQGTFS